MKHIYEIGKDNKHSRKKGLTNYTNSYKYKKLEYSQFQSCIF